MLATAEASLHTGCQFHLKRGEFLLVAAEAVGEGARMAFSPLSGEGAQVVIEVTPEGVTDLMWDLTQCNNTVQHWPQT